MDGAIADHLKWSLSARQPPPKFCVCLPACNEADHLPAMLAAVAAQTIIGPIPIAICLNNTSDASASIIADVAARYAGRLLIDLDIHDFAPALAHAGSARRRAMDRGADWLERGHARGAPAVLISTDADTRPPPDWIAQTLRFIVAGADMVGGRLGFDENEDLPPSVRQLAATGDRYWTMVRAIEDEIDPRPWDKPPRHGDHTGASLAITLHYYRAAGGVPVVPSREDIGLVNQALAAGGRLVHPNAVWTRVSARRDGRASGGMAAAMVDLFHAAQTGGPLMLPSLEQWRERAKWRRALRSQPNGTALIAALEPTLPPMTHDTSVTEAIADWYMAEPEALAHHIEVEMAVTSALVQP